MTCFKKGECVGMSYLLRTQVGFSEDLLCNEMPLHTRITERKLIMELFSSILFSDYQTDLFLEINRLGSQCEHWNAESLDLLHRIVLGNHIRYQTEIALDKKSGNHVVCNGMQFSAAFFLFRNDRKHRGHWNKIQTPESHPTSVTTCCLLPWPPSFRLWH